MENFNTNGLVCDNPKCDWEDASIEFEDFEKYVDYPCPKCGESVLTKDDFEQTKEFFKALELVSNMSEEEQNDLVKFLGGEEELKRQFGIPLDAEEGIIKINIHNGINIEFKENDK